MKPRPRLPLVRVAIALIERSGRYLVSRRRAGSHLAGYWEFPGGKREPGETASACLRRELREELGIDARIGRRVGSRDFRYPDRRVRLEAFRCSIGSQRPRALASETIRWVAADRLAKIKMPPANADLINQLALSSSTTRASRRRTLDGPGH